MMMVSLLLYIVLSGVCLLVGLQVNIREGCLLTGRYNYRPSVAQLPTALSALIIVMLLGRDIITARHACAMLVVSMLLPLVVVVCAEWLLVRIVSPRCRTLTWLYRGGIVVFCCVLLFLLYPSYGSILPLTGFTIAGIFLRNTPFGAPHIKDLCIETYMRRTVEVDWSIFDNEQDIPDLCFAGRQTTDSASERYDIRTLGVIPDSRADQTDAIQAAIDTVGSKGGVLFFPKGRYKVNVRGNSFLQINFSNITIEGEVDAQGQPMAEIICCAPTTRGTKNPWLSPFMITTGEQLQPSNEFWGLDMRKKQSVFSQSNSLSDPGSDGRLLSPSITTTVSAAAKRGETVLHVADSRQIGKYILLGMYNTTTDGNLLHELLGMATFRPEWTLCHRAGVEEAPSYQLLIEVKTIIDEHTIELSRPLLQDIDLVYEPVVCNVNLLENIVIRNLRLTSQWNGCFHHHGFPLYYTIPQTQEMDYGWNAINMKRVAHSEVSNVIIKNFANPIYVIDSRNVTVRGVHIAGYDGHQGIKVYMHACDNLFDNITFTCHFADMMGGEGNAYANVFKDIRYINPEFNPVDYDFHGFGEAAMSPPAHNLFLRTYGFRYIKHAGAITHMPSAAQGNTWLCTITEGECRGDYLFYNMTYRPKRGVVRLITAVGYAVAIAQRQRQLSLTAFAKNIRSKLSDIDAISTNRSNHTQFIPTSHVIALRTWSRSQYG